MQVNIYFRDRNGREIRPERVFKGGRWVIQRNRATPKYVRCPMAFENPEAAILSLCERCKDCPNAMRVEPNGVFCKIAH